MLFYWLRTLSDDLFPPLQPTTTIQVIIMKMQITIEIPPPPPLPITATYISLRVSILSYRPSFARRIFTVLPLPGPSSVEFLPWCPSRSCRG